MNINPAKIRAQSRVRNIIRFWVHFLIELVIVLVVLFFAVWAVITFNGLLHPVDYNIQLPTLTTY